MIYVILVPFAFIVLVCTWLYLYELRVRWLMRRGLKDAFRPMKETEK